MKIGVRKLGGASCMISFCAALPALMKQETREISDLHCDPRERGQGHASQLLEDLCKEADIRRIILLLIADPYGEDAPLSQKDLVRWYTEGFHFQTIQQEPMIMARMYNPFPNCNLTENMGQILTESAQ